MRVRILKRCVVDYLWYEPGTTQDIQVPIARRLIESGHAEAEPSAPPVTEAIDPGPVEKAETAETRRQRRRR